MNLIPPRRRLKQIKKGRRIGNLLYSDFWNEDQRIYDIIMTLQAQNAVDGTEDGRLKLKMSASSLGTPWYFSAHGLNRDCALWHDVYFKHFDFIHSDCMNCWKTVLMTNVPERQYVVDLFRMRDLLDDATMSGKCGVDVRHYTPHRYNGFIYGDSVEQGVEYKNLFKKRMKKEFGDKAIVILKRGCTEFEAKYNDSRQWIITDRQIEFENKLSSIFAPTIGLSVARPVHLTHNQVFRLWIDHAYGIGDPTWRQALKNEGYEDPGEHLYTSAVQYQNMSVKEIYKSLEEGGNKVMERLSVAGGS